MTVSVAQRRHYGRHKRKKTQPTTHITRHRHPRPLLPIIIYNQSTMGMGESFHYYWYPYPCIYCTQGKDGKGKSIAVRKGIGFYIESDVILCKSPFLGVMQEFTGGQDLPGI